MNAYRADVVRINVRLARVRAKQLREHVKWLDKAVGPASFQMRCDMDSAALRLEVMADILAEREEATSGS